MRQILLQLRPVAVRRRHHDVDDGQGEGDGEHAVGERLHPGGSADRAFAFNLVAPRGLIGIGAFLEHSALTRFTIACSNRRSRLFHRHGPT